MGSYGTVYISKLHLYFLYSHTSHLIDYVHSNNDIDPVNDAII